MTKESEIHRLCDELEKGQISRREFMQGLAVLAGGLAGASVLLAACAPTPTPPPEVTAAPGTTPTPTKLAPTATAAPIPGAEPKPGGHFIAALEVDPVGLDPQKHGNFSAIQAHEHIYEGLTEYDESMIVRPCLAESWEMPDDSTYIFHLRKDVKFHDGTDFVADDVKYSFERLLDPETASPMVESFNLIENVEVIDDNTVKFNLADPWAGFLGALAYRRSSSILKAGAAEKMNLDMQSVGTGPFKLVDYVPYDHVEYVKFDDYWKQPLPYVDRFTYKIVVDEEARVAGLRAGALHFAALSAEGAQRITGDENIELFEFPKAWLGYMPGNLGRKPFDDVRVRQAVNYALDFQEIIDKARSGAGVLTGPIATGFGDWYIPLEELPWKQDVAKAKDLLATAGLPDGFETTIKCSPQYPEFVATAVVVAEQLKQIGVKAELIQQEWGEFAHDVSKAGGFNFDMAVSAMSFRSDPDGYFSSWVHPDAAWNTGYDNPTVSELTYAAATSGDSDERHQLYDQIQEIVMEEVPQFWCYAATAFHAVQRTAKGYVAQFSDLRALGFRQVWLDM